MTLTADQPTAVERATEVIGGHQIDACSCCGQSTHIKSYDAWIIARALAHAGLLGVDNPHPGES